MDKKIIKVKTPVHKNLKIMSAEMGCPMGDVIKKLIDERNDLLIANKKIDSLKEIIKEFSNSARGKEETLKFIFDVYAVL